MWLTKIVQPDFLTKNTKLCRRLTISNLSPPQYRPLEI